ncbi:MAG: ATP-dependent helicase HrpB [Bryobacterales bacterium]|nr:ATP-dependent helicase HrpB [Bryobacterales bacterium]
MLPIDSLIPEIVASLRRVPNLVIEAAPGAGKTTRVPPALLPLGGEVLVLEPRRIAARMAARRVAQELGERVGETVGYQVRFEELAGPKTRLRFLTEGVLTRRMMSDPELAGVGTVVLDEFHERHLETDLALALVRRLQKTKRPELRIVVMSATLDVGPVAAFLGNCPSVKSEGRLFELDVSYTPYSAAPLEEQVSGALERLRPEGDVLVFLPGAAEIRRAARACQGLARRQDLLITPLYGDMSPAEQDLAVEPASRRKVILSTNLAESSITIEGVRAVVDSGLARIASDSPWTGLSSLEVRRISKASARQRAGRAGRTGPGQVIRLYTAEDFHRRADHDEPEILRRELSQLCLQLETAGIHDPLELEWLSVPSSAALGTAEQLLDRLRARGPEAARMAKLPVHPRLARLLLDAEQAGAGDHGCRVAALLSSGQRVQTLDDEPDQRTRSVYEQLRRLVRGKGSYQENAIAKALLAAFPDRVGRRRPGGIVLLSNGGTASMANPPGEFLVAVDVEDRKEKSGPVIRLACVIEPEWLIDLFPDRVKDRSGVEWNRLGERVESVSALVYDELVIDESRGGAVDDEAAAKLLASKALEAGIERFVDRAELDEFFARVEFASEHSAIQPFSGDGEIVAALADLCYGLRRLSEVEKNAGALIPTLERRVDASLLERVAPSRLKLPSGRMAKVHYERGKPPWVASRLQDFFGMMESPRVAGGKVPLVVHLLAPNQRPVQMTTDLAGFWERLYPQLRRELGRRYPRHAWPENPAVVEK